MGYGAQTRSLGLGAIAAKRNQAQVFDIAGNGETADSTQSMISKT
jgi:hypothetical protein